MRDGGCLGAERQLYRLCRALNDPPRRENPTSDSAASRSDAEVDHLAFGARGFEIEARLSCSRVLAWVAMIRAGVFAGSE